MRSGAFLAGILCFSFLFLAREPARASVFCEADIATVLGWNATSGMPDTDLRTGRYAVVLFANNAATLSGNIIALTDDKAYDIRFSGVKSSKSADFSDQYVSDTFFVMLPPAEHIRFAWVDEVGVNGAPARTCPTDPFDPSDPGGPVGPFRLPATPAGVRAMSSFPGVFKMDLPAVDCAEPYRPAKLVKQRETLTETFDTSQGLKTNLLLRAFLDSDGKVADVRIVRSSGSAAVDNAAKGIVATSQYAPAAFRCVPVVGTVNVDFDYEVQQP